MEIYHALNRGVEKRTIFLDTQDYARFVRNMYEFNDTSRVLNLGRSLASEKMSDLGGHSLRQRERLVDIHAWCLMRNHFHLLLSQRTDGGISKFLMKVNVGYAKYFNKKYKRDGGLFQGKTKKILIERDAQWNYILHYIHLNPLDYLKGASDWRIRSKSGIQNPQGAIEYLKKYRWSSYLDYAGEKNFPSILTTNVFGTKDYRVTLSKYLKQNQVANNVTLRLE